MNTTTSKHPIHALETALQVYESGLFAIDLINRAKKFGACLFHNRLGDNKVKLDPPTDYANFRKFLLNATSDPFDIHKIGAYGGLLESALERYPDGLRSLLKNNIPAGLYRWNAFSRRAFELSPDIELLLRNTDVQKMRLADVPWPFENFVICTNESISQTSADCKCLLVTIVRADEGSNNITNFSLRLFPSGGNPKLVLMSQDRAELTRLFREKRWQRLNDRLTPYMEVWSAYQIGNFSTPVNACVDTLFEDHFQGKEPLIHNSELSGPIKPDDVIRTFREALNLAIGLSCYLTTLPANSPARSDWNKLQRSLGLPDPRAITNPTEVCQVSSTHTLTNEEREAFSGKRELVNGTYQLCAHFRRGHWRKPPGKGHDPTAEKVNWVRPTLVRRDRLAEGTLPGGAITKVH